MFGVSLCFACSACSGKDIDAQVTNQSGSEISKVVFTTSEKLDSLGFPVISDKEDITGRLSMAGNKTDGEYVLRFTIRRQPEKAATSTSDIWLEVGRGCTGSQGKWQLSSRARTGAGIGMVSSLKRSVNSVGKVSSKNANPVYVLALQLSRIG